VNGYCTSKVVGLGGVPCFPVSLARGRLLVLVSGRCGVSPALRVVVVLVAAPGPGVWFVSFLVLAGRGSFGFPPVFGVCVPVAVVCAVLLGFWVWFPLVGVCMGLYVQVL